RSNGFCGVIGDYLDGPLDTDRNAFIDTLQAGKWTTTEAPVLADSAPVPSSRLSDVACSDATCIAVGGYNTAPAANRGYAVLIETSDGSGWQPSSAPVPTNALNPVNAALSSIACRPNGFCVAAGTYYDNHDVMEGLIETLSNGRWIATEAPVPSDAADPPGARPDQVACDTATTCVVSGRYSDRDGTYPPPGFLDSLTADGWSAAREPLPSD